MVAATPPMQTHLRMADLLAGQPKATYVVLPFVDLSSLKTLGAHRRSDWGVAGGRGTRTLSGSVELHVECDLLPPAFPAICSTARRNRT